MAANKLKIAIVDDDTSMRKGLEAALMRCEDFEVRGYKNAKDALKNINESNCDIVVSDICMPDINGLEFLRRLDERFGAIVITGYADLSYTIEAMQLGVRDFLIKGRFKDDELIAAIRRVQKIRSFKTKAKSIKIQNEVNLEGEGIAAIKAKALKCAKTDASVLLLGESGTGKEVFARFIHDNSPRAGGPFVAINMSAIPENLLESELFGFEKGAFTDAAQAKTGLFEMANKGSIFLDEIAEMPLTLQPKLLRALQEKEITRLGGTKPTKIDVRFIAATNADIREKIRQRGFREDLFYRLQTIEIEIPPLRERKDEVEAIAKAQLKNIAKAYDLGQKELSSEALEALLTYPWPGNIRELLSVIERAAILSEGESITRADLGLKP